MTTGLLRLRCVLCGADWAAKAGPARIQPCPSCGLPTTVPPPSRDVFSDELFTDGAYGGKRLAARPQWLREAGTRLRWVSQHLSSGRLLEIGAATGEFVAVAERAGYDVVGLEASAWAVQAAQDLTTCVLRADHTTWLQGKRFDGAVMFHVLEHVHEPVAFLRPVVEALVPGGLLLLELPNGDARDARDGADWLGARFDDHVVHYREEDLRRLLGDVGLTVTQVSSITMREFDRPPVWLLRRLRWLAHGRLAPSRDFLRVVAIRS